MTNTFFVFIFLFFSIGQYDTAKEKLTVNITTDKLTFNADSSELIILATIRNTSNKTYFMYKYNSFNTCNSSQSFWNLKISLGDSLQLSRQCLLVNYDPISRWESLKLRKGAEKIVTFKLDLRTIASMDNQARGLYKNTHFGNYSAVLSYCDRDRLNNKSEREVFTSNKIYFTYQK